MKKDVISLERWKEISESIVYILEREYGVTNEEATEVISALLNKESERVIKT